MSKKASTDASVIVGTLPELSDADKAKAEAYTAHILSKAADLKTDPSTRPAPAGKTVTAESTFDLENLKPVHVVIDKKGVKSLKGGYLPHRNEKLDPDLTDEKRAEMFAPYINLFPQGDMDNFRIERWAMAVERSQNTLEGSLAFQKYAPWETAYYSAYAKAAQGDQVSGTDGGFLAPEQWSSQFIDQIYASQALARLPVTRMNMPTRVLHIPKLTTAVTVSYAGENASLTANSSGFNQLSFTARKQYIFVQVSNELIRDSNPSAVQVILNNAQKWAAIDRDKQSLIGDGTAGKPLGLVNVGGVAVASGTFGTNSSPLFTELITGMANVENLNNSTNVPVGQTTCTGVYGPTALKSQILAMKDTTNNRPLFSFGLDQIRGGNTAPDASGSNLIDGLLGIPTWAFSNALGEAANSRHVIFGDWQHLYIMLRQDTELLTSNVAGTAFASDQTWIRLITRYDVGCAHPEAFYTFTNG